MNAFQFIESYRTIVPAATKDIVDARHKGHDKLFPLLKTMDKVYDLCRLALQIPCNTASLTEWFDKTIREFDPQFSVSIDKAEAGRIATLLLRDLISRSNPQAALAVLASSYCGRREPIDGGALLETARDALTDAGRERRIVGTERKIAPPASKDLKAEFDTLQPNFSAETVRSCMDAMLADLRDDTTRLAASANDAFQSLRNSATRLAEEVDMLWWYIGDWSEVVNKPRGALPEDAIAITSGVEIGSLVREIPGPYGAYGILRQSVGKFGDHKAKLKEIIGAIGEDDVKKLARDLPQFEMDVFPVHAAIRLFADRGAGGWIAAFDRVAGDVMDSDLTHYELAIQTFRERVLIKNGGLGQ